MQIHPMASKPLFLKFPIWSTKGQGSNVLLYHKWNF